MDPFSITVTTRLSSDMTAFNITRIPAFHDNYLWLLDDGSRAAVVDPGDAQPIIDELERRQLTLTTILTTHHHPDHTGGIQPLVERYQAEVYGPNSQYIPQVRNVLSDGDRFELFSLAFQVIEVPGHTLDHIAYFYSGDHSAGLSGDASHVEPLLFCGDTLFAGGCGRVFEGSHAQMRQSLQKLRELPDSTRIFCAHEYTQSNLAFALAVEPENTELQHRAQRVAELREQQQATVPSTLADELNTNPFLRYDQAPVIDAAQRYNNQQRRAPFNVDDDEVFAIIRQWKDEF